MGIITYMSYFFGKVSRDRRVHAVSNSFKQVEKIQVIKEEVRDEKVCVIRVEGENNYGESSWEFEISEEELNVLEILLAALSEMNPKPNTYVEDRSTLSGEVELPPLRLEAKYFEGLGRKVLTYTIGGGK